MRFAKTLTVLAIVVAPALTLAPADAGALPPVIDPGTITLPPILPVLQTCNGEIATIVGTPTHDILIGTEGHDVIVGLGGHDQIWGNGGRDTICAGRGDDLIAGGAGRDFLDGQGGYDLLGYGTQASGIRANLGLHRVLTGSGTDTVHRAEFVYGTPHDDRIVGDFRNNRLDGAGGNDYIDGRGGADTCAGPIQLNCEYPYFY